MITRFAPCVASDAGGIGGRGGPECADGVDLVDDRVSQGRSAGVDAFSAPIEIAEELLHELQQDLDLEALQPLR